ncbi:tRNA/rRNA methyltransferase [Edwardsiella hoshinae]|uniref:tRNA/rRNA methyltransferase n=1 Tax=Edwardsiella hoshinae TaxID=93378 RepID=A0ABN4T134_9GAMM|nr:tRNA/rRNA methyltransferase [Edwardsiella hoshinae]AOV97892.1 tRNA/rRNA methyltransferase [Edwardsiella hoshinae]
MNDSLNGKNGKVKVMYVRDADTTDARSSRTSGKGRQGQSGRGERAERSRGDRTDRPRHERGGRPARADKPSAERSPWRTVALGDSPAQVSDHGGISGKSFIDPEQLRRQRAEETRVYGENACQALFASRPEAIVRAWFLQSVTPRFREALRWMAANRKAYHVVDDAELTKASGTDHHGGVCFLIKKRRALDVQQYLASQAEQAVDCVLALENVANPHNLGGIMRTCAHFGIRGIMAPESMALESGAAVRTAEGGAEHVQAIDAEDFAATLDTFRRAGYTIVTTSSHKGTTQLHRATLPAKIVLVVGHEGDGLSDGTLHQGDLSISIGGTGSVESLNVSVATGIMLAEWWRQNTR